MCVLNQNNDTLEIICSAEKFGKILAILRPISKVLVMLLKVIEKHICVLVGGGDPPEPSWLQRFPR